MLKMALLLPFCLLLCCTDHSMHTGGAFRDWPVERLKNVTVQDALKHPNWRCGSLATAPGAWIPLEILL